MKKNNKLYIRIRWLINKYLAYGYLSGLLLTNVLQYLIQN